jgi:hypothetical protein
MLHLQRSRYLNATTTLSTLLSLGVIPIINENDTISVSEILHINKFGDNDTLSAIAAGMCGADYLFLMTDVDGLYEDNPRRVPGARRVSKVRDIEEVRKLGESDLSRDFVASRKVWQVSDALRLPHSQHLDAGIFARHGWNGDQADRRRTRDGRRLRDRHHARLDADPNPDHCPEPLGTDSTFLTHARRDRIPAYYRSSPSRRFCRSSRAVAFSPSGRRIRHPAPIFFFNNRRISPSLHSLHAQNLSPVVSAVLDPARLDPARNRLCRRRRLQGLDPRRTRRRRERQRRSALGGWSYSRRRRVRSGAGGARLCPEEETRRRCGIDDDDAGDCGT